MYKLYLLYSRGYATKNYKAYNASPTTPGITPGTVKPEKNRTSGAKNCTSHLLFLLIRMQSLPHHTPVKSIQRHPISTSKPPSLFPLSMVSALGTNERAGSFPLCYTIIWRTFRALKRPTHRATPNPNAQRSPCRKQKKKLGEQPRMRGGQKPTQKLHGTRRSSLSANLLMLTPLGWQPKGENKPVLALLKPLQVSARDFDLGSGPNGLTARILEPPARSELLPRSANRLEASVGSMFVCEAQEKTRIASATPPFQRFASLVRRRS
jgi:hypothetical protein